MIFNLKLRKKAASWAKATSTQSDQITLNFEASAKTNKTFAEAKSRKQLKSLQQSDAEVIYESATGKLYFNANGKDKGWGDKNKSGFFAKIRGKPSLSAFNLNGYTNLFQSELNAYAISMQSDKSLREFVKLLKKPSRAMSKFIKKAKKIIMNQVFKKSSKHGYHFLKTFKICTILPVAKIMTNTRTTKEVTML